MLLFSNKAITVQGVTVFPDHKDPDQFWYLGTISLAKKDGKPEFTLLKYTSDAAQKGGGFLAFTADLSLDEQTRNDILSELRKISKKPRLAPVVFDKGSVKVAAGNVGQENISGLGVPSLAGDNSAAFSLNLTEEQATLFQRSFQNQGKPVGIFYDLEFTGLRPALEVKVTADFQQIENALGVGFKATIPLSQDMMNTMKVDLSTQLKWLQENQGLKIEILSQIDDADTEKQREWALQYFTEQLLKDYFKPQIKDGDVWKDAGDPQVADQITQAVSDAVLTENETEGAAASGGASPKPLLSPINWGTLGIKFVRKEETKTATYTYSSTRAWKQRYAPQGFFGILLKNLDPKAHFQEINLNDDFFKKIQVSVSGPLDFDSIGLESVSVALKYGGDYKGDFTFDRQSNQRWAKEFSTNAKRDTAYDYQLEYRFKPNTLSGWEGEKNVYPIKAESTQSRSLQIDPYNSLGFLDIAVTLERNFVWAEIQEIEVHLSYASKIWKPLPKLLRFFPDSPTEQHWKLRLSDPEVRSYTSHFVYKMQDGSTHKTEPVTTSVSTLVVPDRTNGKLNIDIVSLLNPITDQLAFVDVIYTDEANGYNWTGDRTLTAGAATPVPPLVIPLMDASKRKFNYRCTFVSVNNQQYTQSEKEREDRRIFIKSAGRPAYETQPNVLTINVDESGLDFKRFDSVTVFLKYEHGTTLTKTFRYTQVTSEIEEWSIPVNDPKLNDYKYRIEIKHKALDTKINWPGPGEDKWGTSSNPVLALSELVPDDSALARQIGKFLVKVETQAFKVGGYETIQVVMKYNNLEKRPLLAPDQLPHYIVFDLNPAANTYQWRVGGKKKDGTIKRYPTQGDATDRQTVLNLDQYLLDNLV